MLNIKLKRACMGKAGHTKFFNNRTVQPVVMSEKRYNAIMYRSRMDQKHDKQAAMDEEQRYIQYLKDGSNKLISLFTNMGPPSLDAEKQAKLAQELEEGRLREQQVKKEDDELRKERIMRANRILEDLKPGQRALHHALVESEMIYQRKYNEALNREISEDALRQHRLEDQQCPEMLIPFCGVTEEQEKAEQEAKAQAIRAHFLKELEERRQKRLAEKEEKECECIVERAQYKCLQEKEEKAANELAERKREFCRRAYRDSLKEKAKIAKYEEMCEKIDHRVICVDLTRRRNLDARYNKEFKAILQNKIRDRENRAVRICQLQQANKRKDHQLQDGIQERYEFEVLADEGRRQCELEELSKQRRAYELEERNQAEKQRERDAQIRRFEVAERFKNQESNKRFYDLTKQRNDKVTADLKDVLHSQREEFLERRQNELMRMSACQADPYLQQDVSFFNDAVRDMKQARKDGRPIYPMAKAVETYRRQNQIDMVPEGRMVRRSKLRDYCWPGYFSKADLAYKKYEHRENCRHEQEKDRHQIFTNCIKITKMAAEEKPYKECITECPIKCFQHRGMPPIESVSSFDCGKNVCYEDDPPIGACPSDMQIIKPCEKDLKLKLKENVASSQCPELDAPSKTPTDLKHHTKGSSLIISRSPSGHVRVPNRSGTLRSLAGANQIGDKSLPSVSPSRTSIWR